MVPAPVEGKRTPRLLVAAALLAVGGLGIAIALPRAAEPENRRGDAPSSSRESARIGVSPDSRRSDLQESVALHAAARASEPPTVPPYVQALLDGRVTDNDFESIRLNLMREPSEERVLCGLVGLAQAMDPRVRATAACHLAWGYPIAHQEGFAIDDTLLLLSRDREVPIRRLVVSYGAEYDSKVMRRVLIERLADHESDLFAGFEGVTPAQEAARVLKESYGEDSTRLLNLAEKDRQGWIDAAVWSGPRFKTGTMKVGERAKVEMPELGTGFTASIDLRRVFQAAMSLHSKTEDFVDFSGDIYTASGGHMGSFGTGILPSYSKVTYESQGIRVQAHFRILGDESAKYWIAATRRIER